VPICLDQYKSGEYAQHGEHGVIEAVFREIGVKSRSCVEVGAYDLKKFSNVYPLWTSGWQALLLEGDKERYAKLISDYAAHPQYGEQRVHIANRFVAEAGADSLDCILAEHGFPTDLDFVSIDVDGLDLHIWRGLQKFTPRLVVVEYNPTIPPHLEIIGDGRGNNIGCSALALARLGQQKGCSLVACIGWNAFFVRQEYAHLFADADNLEALFDFSYLRYAMQSYNGEVFFSAPLHLQHVPMFCQDSDAIEQSPVTLGKTRNTLLGVGNTVMRYCQYRVNTTPIVAAMRRRLRPLKRLYWRLRASTR
jgi:hypothetical protein